jgi:hypothetical protein
VQCKFNTEGTKILGATVKRLHSLLKPSKLFQNTNYDSARTSQTVIKLQRPTGWTVYGKQWFHSSVICHTTGPQPLPKRFLHLMRYRASSFKLEYPLLSPSSSSNFLRLLPRLLVTSIRPFIFPSITSFRWQFLRKIWPIQLAFRFLITMVYYKKMHSF